MSNSAQSSHGITVEWSTDDITYNSVGEVRDTTLPVPEADEVETSDHSSLYKTFLPGMVDLGEFSTELNFKLDDTQHKALRAAVGSMVYVHVTAPAAIVADNQLQFYGVLKKAGPEDAPLGGVFRGAFTVKVSGNVTVATV